MKRRLVALLVALSAILLTIPASAAAQSSATVTLMHGIPGATVDVVVDGAVVIPGFQPGTMQDISSFAGQTLMNVEVRAAGTDTVVIGPLGEPRRAVVGQLDGPRPSGRRRAHRRSRRSRTTRRQYRPARGD